jgi:putative phosphoesterase
MRILLVSDIHGNRAAIESIREEFDCCVFLGDLVDYCLEPGPCIDWVQKNATYAIRGNHDHGAAQKVLLSGHAGYRYLTSVTRPSTIESLTDPHRRFLASLPTTRMLTLGGKTFLFAHATPRDPMDEYAPPDVDFWRRRLEGVKVDYVCVGHTHVQFALHVGTTTVVNPGSVGLPRDGDPRAAYAIITDEGPLLKRIEYPIEQTVQSIEGFDIGDHAKHMLAEVLRTGKLGRKNGNGHPPEALPQSQ